VFSFGKRVSEERKEKNISRDELGNLIGTSSAVIGQYERDDVKPSFDVAIRLASALDLNLEYLAGKEDKEPTLDKKTLYRLELLEKLPDADKNRITETLDALIRDAQFKNTQEQLA